MVPKFHRDTQEKIDKIVKSTIELLAVNNFHAVSVNRIASQAEVGIGTIYRNFPEGKKDIILHITQTSIDQFNFSVEEDKLGKISFRLILQNLIFNQIRQHTHTIPINKALEQIFMENSEIFQEYQQQVHKTINNFAEILKKHPDVRHIPIMDLKKRFIITYEFLEAMIHRHFYLGPIFQSIEGFVEYLTEISVITIIEKEK